MLTDLSTCPMRYILVQYAQSMLLFSCVSCLPLSLAPPLLARFWLPRNKPLLCPEPLALHTMHNMRMCSAPACLSAHVLLCITKAANIHV